MNSQIAQINQAYTEVKSEANTLYGGIYDDFVFSKIYINFPHSESLHARERQLIDGNNEEASLEDSPVISDDESQHVTR